MSDFYSPSPPVLQFTPEVQSGELAAALLAVTSLSAPEPTLSDLELLAQELLTYAPELAHQLMEVGMRKLEAA